MNLCEDRDIEASTARPLRREAIAFLRHRGIRWIVAPDREEGHGLIGRALAMAPEAWVSRLWRASKRTAVPLATLKWPHSAVVRNPLPEQFAGWLSRQSEPGHRRLFANQSPAHPVFRLRGWAHARITSLKPGQKLILAPS